MPLTAAMTGFQRSLLFGPMFSPGSSKWNGVDRDPTTRSLTGEPMVSMRSMPVQKAFSPAPVSTTQRTLSSPRSERHRVRSSSCMRALNALSTSGRLRVSQPTPSVTSNVMVSKSAILARSSSGQPQNPLGDDVALDLARAARDGRRERREEPRGPVPVRTGRAAVDDGAVRPEQTNTQLAERLLQLGRSELQQRMLGRRMRAEVGEALVAQGAEGGDLLVCPCELTSD